MEYNCPLWSPHKVNEINILESVQTRFTAKISSVCDLDYWERLKQLKPYVPTMAAGTLSDYLYVEIDQW